MKFVFPLLLAASLSTAAPSVVGPARPAWTPDVPALKKRAEAGEAQAQVDLGVAYRDGNQVQRDPAAAVKWFREAQAQGFPAAFDHLGWMYLQGLGVGRDYVEARGLFAEGCERGAPFACLNLAECAVLGLGAPTNDLAQAWRSMVRAAELDCEPAYTRLATLALLTRPPAQSPAALADTMERLRGNGHAVAARVLGFQYYFGAGRPADRAQAEKFWQEADARSPVYASLLTASAWAALRDHAAEPGAFVFLHLPPLAQGMNLCAATAGACALRGLGVDAEPLELKRRCPASPLGDGTAWDQLSQSMRTFGVEVELATFGLDEAGGRAGWARIRAELDAGRPVIIDVREPAASDPNRAAHSVVVMGYDAAKALVYVQNSAVTLPGVEAYALVDFLKRWNSRWYMPNAPAECRPALFLRRTKR